jgi:hypothetical protein
MDIYLAQTFYSYTTLDIGQMANLSQWYGARVQSVRIMGSSTQNSYATIRVLADGRDEGAIAVGPTYQDQTIFIRETLQVGWNLNSLVLAIDPNVHIEHVMITVIQ